MKASFVDTQGLFQTPSVPNAVQWSEEGILAVAAGAAVTLLHPGRLDGPRGFVGLTGPASLAALEAAGAPQDPSDVHYELNNLRRTAFTSTYQVVQAELAARGVAWSPAGCSPHDGCLLAVVANDHRVRRGQGQGRGLGSEPGAGSKALPCALCACCVC